MLEDMGGKTLPRVIEKMAPTTKATLVLARIDGDKIVVTSATAPGKIVVLKGEVLEVRVVDGRLRIVRKDRFHDAGDPPIEPYDPYGPGMAEEVLVSSHDADAGTDAQPKPETSTTAGTNTEPVTGHTPETAAE